MRARARLAPLLSVGLAIAGVAGCGSSGSARQKAQLASLTFDVPAAWQHDDSHARGVATTVWHPAADDNERRETVTVIRSELSPAVAKAGAATISRLVARAQGALHDARVSAVTPVTTAHGLAGVRLEVDYVPPGLRQRYHRVHVVLADPDGLALIHVLYTARTPDDELDALNLVLGSIRHGEVQS